MTRCAIGFAVVTAVVGLAAPAHADPTPTVEQDQRFQRLLTDDGTLFSFPRERMQALRACGQMDGGMKVVDAVNELMSDGSYSWGVANSIISAAVAVYCPIPVHS